MISRKDIRVREFRGRKFRFVAAANIPASYETFDDEIAVRQELWTIREGDVVFDIGAAYGSYSLAALAVGASRVYAWAPQGHPVGPIDEMEADYLEASFAVNGWSARTKVYRDGLYSKTGWLNAWTQEFMTAEPPKQANGRYANHEFLPVRTFEDWLRAEAPQGGIVVPPGARVWVKLDVEGAEVEILKSSLRALTAFTPHIFVENHNFKRASIEQEVRSLLTGSGYREVVTRPYRDYSHSLYTP